MTKYTLRNFKLIKKGGFEKMKENTTPTVSDIFQTLFKENKSQFTENFNKL